MAAEKLKPRPSPLLVADDAVEIRADAVGAALLEGVAGARISWPRRRPSRPRRSAAASRSARTARPRLPCRRRAASSFTAISKPGFSGITGAKIAPAVKLVTSRTRQVPRMAPRILLSSKESIFGSGSRPERSTLGRRERPRMSIRNQAFAPHPEPAMRYRFARALATRINAPSFRPIPIISGLLSTGSRPHSDDRNPHFGADSRPHGRHPPARQAAAGHRRPADDRPCAAPGRGRRDRPRRGRHRHARDRRGGDGPMAARRS